MTVRSLIITFVLVIFLLPSTSFGAPMSQALGEEYISNKKETGMDFRMRPPAGWKSTLYKGSDGIKRVVFYKGASLEATDHGIAILKTKDIDNALWYELQAVVVDDPRASSFARIDDKQALYRHETNSGMRFVSVRIPVKDAYYTIVIHVPEDELESYQDVLGASIDTFHAKEESLVERKSNKKTTKDSTKAPTTLALEKKFVMGTGASMTVMRMKPPAGWYAVESTSSESMSFVKTEDGKTFAGVTIERINRNEKITSQVAQFADMLEIMGFSEAAKKSRVKIGSLSGTVIEVSPGMGNPGYGKVFFLSKDEYSYNIVLAASTKSMWKKYKGIMEKSAKTFRLGK